MATVKKPINFPEISIIFCTCLVLSAVAGMMFPRLLAYLPAAFGLIFASYAYLSKKIEFKFPKYIGLFFGAALIMILASCCYSPDESFSLERTIKICLIVLPSLFLIGVAQSINWPSSKRFNYALLIVHFIFSVFLLTERLSGHQILTFITNESIPQSELNRHFVVFSLYSLCLLFHFRIEKQKLLSLITLAFSIAALSVAESQTSQLGFIIGILFFYIFPARYSWLVKTVLAAVIIFCLTFPFMIKTMKASIPEEVLLEGIARQASIVHRLEVWEHSVDKTMEKPIFGHGIEALRFLKSSKWMPHQNDDSILHSHNAALQIWLEFGLIGILLSCGFLSYLFIKVANINDLPKRQFYLALLMSCLCISFTGYGLWQSWQLGMFMLFAAIAFTLGNKPTTLKT